MLKEKRESILVDLQGNYWCSYWARGCVLLRFSILIPVHNVEKHLRQCIDSVIKQDFQSKEIILIDDGSSDLSGEICDEYKSFYPRDINVVHQKNEGLLSTRRKLFNLANGEYCICLDSDDFLEKNTLKTLSSIIDETSPNFILFGFNYYDENTGKSWGDKFPLIPNSIYHDVDVLKQALLEVSFPSWSLCAKCIKTDLAKIPFDYQKYKMISYGEDTLQSIVLYNHCNDFYYCDELMYNYRINSGMTKKRTIKYMTDFMLVKDAMRQLCFDWTEDIDNAAQVYFSKIYFSYIYNIISESDSIAEMKCRVNELKEFSVINGIKDIDCYCYGKNLISSLIKHRLFLTCYVLFNVKRKIKRLIKCQ